MAMRCWPVLSAAGAAAASSRCDTRAPSTTFPAILLAGPARLRKHSGVSSSPARLLPPPGPRRSDQVRDALSRDLEAARYSADRAFRQYDAADPESRLVAELEARWNQALIRIGRSRARSRRMIPRRRGHYLCWQRASRRWPQTSRLSGRRRRRTPGSRSASCAPSSKK